MTTTTPTDSGKCWTPTALAARWDMSRNDVYKLIRLKYLRVLRIGRRVRITAAEVERFEEKHATRS